MHEKSLNVLLFRPSFDLKPQVQGSHIFIDGAVGCIPKPFYQCVIVMVHDDASDIFLPVFCVLCITKTQELVIATTDEKLFLETVVHVYFHKTLLLM